MNKDTKYNEFIKFVMASVEHDSSDMDSARQYLSAEGLDVQSLVDEGLKRIKQIQMKIRAEKTKDEMKQMDLVKGKAEAWVEDLLSSTDFSLEELIEEENLAVTFRGLKELTKDDIKNILVKHFTLKFHNDSNNKGF